MIKMLLKWKPPKTFVRLSFFGTAVGGIVLTKEFIAGKNYEGKEKLDNKTVIVTGANTGIGKETAMELAKRGATVIMACRDWQKCKIARKDVVLGSLNRSVYCEECDLASLKSIRKFAEGVKKSYSNVHILINNAGVMRCEKSRTKEGFEMQLGTNHFGHFLLTMLLLDKLKESSPSRIINVSSVAHMRGSINFEDLNGDKMYDPKDAYNQSKLANMLFTVELADRLKDTGVTCNAIHPGLVNTDIARHLGFSKSLFAKAFLQPFVWLFLKTPQKGAQTTVYAALNENLANVSGKYFSNQKEAKPSELIKDKEISKRLWAVSEKWTGLS